MAEPAETGSKAARRDEAVRLRRAGMTYAAIGRRLGITGPGARQLVLRAVG
jgi:DNA-binding CsgD family transcriptional regulator